MNEETLHEYYFQLKKGDFVSNQLNQSTVNPPIKSIRGGFIVTAEQCKYQNEGLNMAHTGKELMSFIFIEFPPTRDYVRRSIPFD